MKTIIHLILLMPTILFAQTKGTISIHKPTKVVSCGNCVQNRFFLGSSGMRIFINSTDSFKKEKITCYKVQIYRNDTLLTCFQIQPDNGAGPTYDIPQGKYDIKVSADNISREFKAVAFNAEITTPLFFNFDSNELEKDRKEITTPNIN